MVAPRFEAKLQRALADDSPAGRDERINVLKERLLFVAIEGSLERQGRLLVAHALCRRHDGNLQILGCSSEDNFQAWCQANHHDVNHALKLDTTDLSLALSDPACGLSLNEGLPLQAVLPPEDLREIRASELGESDEARQQEEVVAERPSQRPTIELNEVLVDGLRSGRVEVQEQAPPAFDPNRKETSVLVSSRPYRPRQDSAADLRKLLSTEAEAPAAAAAQSPADTQENSPPQQKRVGSIFDVLSSRRK